MAIEDKKITTAEINTNHVQAAADRPKGTAAENKQIFDRLPELIAQKHNGLIDELDVAIDGKANDDEVVHLANAESITGEKTFESNVNIKGAKELVFNSDNNSKVRVRYDDGSDRLRLYVGNYYVGLILTDEDYEDMFYPKPSNGIPKTDLASGVQTSLDKADNAQPKETGKGLSEMNYSLEDYGAVEKLKVTGGVGSFIRVLARKNDTETATWHGLLARDVPYDQDYNVEEVLDIKYTKPSTGIPKTDLASAVQASLGKADNAYSKPSTGIPKTDLASAVQTSLGLADTALQTHQDISGKANDNAVVHLADAENIVGAKTFENGLNIKGDKYLTFGSDGANPVKLCYDSGSDRLRLYVGNTYIGLVLIDVDYSDVAQSGDYNDLTNKPTIPSVNNATLTIKQGDTVKGTFTANSSTDTTVTLDSSSWDDITGKPSTFPPSDHSHDEYYEKPSTGIPKTDLASSVQTSLGLADTALQTHQDISGKANDNAVVHLADAETITGVKTFADNVNITGYKSLVLGSNKANPQTIEFGDNNRPTLHVGSTRVGELATYGDVEYALAPIESKIPPQASSSNQLADKNFVNSSIGTNTANYISNSGQPFTSLAQLQAYTGTVTNNDYAFVTGTDSEGNTYFDRYKATVSGTSVSWAKEYRLNNSSFTSEQWSAISSGITSGKIASYDSHIALTNNPHGVTKAQVGLGKVINQEILVNRTGYPSASSLRNLIIDGDSYDIPQGTYDKPSGGIPKTDLASAVQTSLGKADTALQNTNDCVHLANAESITGEKTFESNVNIKGAKELVFNSNNNSKVRICYDDGSDRLRLYVGNIYIGLILTDEDYEDMFYSKPSTGIPKTDLAGAVQTSLGLADSALQTHQDISGKQDKSTLETDVAAKGFTKNTGTITGITMNGSSKGTSGVVNLGTVLTAHQDISGKENTFSKSIYVGSSGNPRPVKFCTVDYTSCGSENGVFIKIRAVSGHGNGSSYNFLEDIFLSVNYLNQVSVNNYKYYQDTVAYDSATRAYGDIFWVIDTANKIVDFYILCGQYSTVKFTPYERLNNSNGGVITQYTSLNLYSSGIKVYANNTLYATDNNVVHLANAENITGVKTFNEGINIYAAKPIVFGSNKTNPVKLSYGENHDRVYLHIGSTYIGYLTTDSDVDDAISGKQDKSSLETDVAAKGFTKNAGTITGIKMNGSSKGTSGVVDLGTVLTAHQDISGKVNKSGDTMTGDLVVGDSAIRTNGYIEGSWLRAYSTTDLGSTPDVCVMNSGWVYKRTPSGFKSDLNLQDKLVSGTNIKTINNQSVLGSGNINVGGVTPNDYVTEEDTSNSWTYRKWNNGKMEAWLTIRNSSQITFTSATGGGHTTLSARSLPSGYTAAPIVFASACCSDTGAWLGLTANDITTTSFTPKLSRHFSNNSLSANTLTMSYYAVGNWK